MDIYICPKHKPFITRLRVPPEEVIKSVAVLLQLENSNSFVTQALNPLNPGWTCKKLPTLLPLNDSQGTVTDITCTRNNNSIQGMAAPEAPSRKRPVIENKSSQLLSKEENDLVFSLLGKRCFTMATAVVQLLTSDPPNHVRWNRQLTGVVCFVKDNPRRSYFIRVFDIDNRKQCVWEQELYFTFEYKASRPYFHTFEADNCMAGLSFANESEANRFREAVEEKLKLRAQKKHERRRQTSNTNHGNSSHAGLAVSGNKTVSSQPRNDLSVNNNYKYNAKKDKGKRGENRIKLTKSDIGLPSNFVHVQHVGWNPDTGFDVRISEDLNNVGPDLKKFFAVAGVSEQQLKDDETRNFIYSFIDSHGGVDKAIESIKAAPTIPIHKPNVSAPLQSVPQLAPQVPSRQHHQHHHHQIARPPPPPPMPSMSAPMSSIPPPPPPPPVSMNIPGAAPLPPPPPPMPPIMEMASNGASDASRGVNGKPQGPPVPGGGHLRNALMEQIRQGAKLNPVDAETDSVKSSGSSNGGGRDALLTQIRKGVELRKVDPCERKASDVPEPVGMAAALKKALEMRQKMMNSDSEDESGSSCPDEEEWADDD